MDSRCRREAGSTGMVGTVSQALPEDRDGTRRISMKEPPKFTPGPWRATDQGEGPRGKSLGYCISAARGFPLFIVPRGNTQVNANAHLIAAAPELYDFIAALENDDGKIPAWLWE